MNWLNQCHFGDVREVLRRMIADDVKVNTIVTSPPYWGLRSYLPAGHEDKGYEIGSEPTLREFLDTMVGVFDLCRQVLADDGTMFVNMGDGYATGGTKEFKPKDLIGQPWRLAFALQDAGWWLRQDIIWNKPNPMPESIKDRCTKAHEYLFLLAKSERYYYDFEAMQEPVNGGAHSRRPSNGVGFGYAEPEPKARTIKKPDGWATHEGGHGSFHKGGREKGAYTEVGQRQGPPGNPSPKAALVDTENAGAYADGKSERMGRGAGWRERKLAEAGSGTKNNDSMDDALSVMPSTRNRRSVWTIPSEPYKGSHFATFPRALIEPCILAGAPAGGTVLDIFMGSGTTAQVAEQLGRKWIGIDIDIRNKALQDERLRQPSLDLEAA